MIIHLCEDYLQEWHLQMIFCSKDQENNILRDLFASVATIARKTSRVTTGDLNWVSDLIATGK